MPSSTPCCVVVETSGESHVLSVEGGFVKVRYASEDRIPPTL